MVDPTLFGPRLKSLRDARGWSRGELDREAKLPGGSVARYEEGKGITLDSLAQLSEALGVSLAELTGEESKPGAA